MGKVLKKKCEQCGNLNRSLYRVKINEVEMEICNKCVRKIKGYKPRGPISHVQK